jgi:TRAP-type C4-dicarboxylate transport system substrate-binding protein
VRTFDLLGAVPLKWDLSEVIAAVKAGTIDAQENPFANTVTYGVHQSHHFHTVSNHFYLSRPIFLHRASFDAWPEDVQEAMRSAVTAAVAMQRDMAVAEEEVARRAILDAGCEIIKLSPEEQEAFAATVRPVIADFRRRFGKEMFELAVSPTN